MQEPICCFIGHHFIPEPDESWLMMSLDREITYQIERGVRVFAAGVLWVSTQWRRSIFCLDEWERPESGYSSFYLTRNRLRAGGKRNNCFMKELSAPPMRWSMFARVIQRIVCLSATGLWLTEVRFASPI